MKGSRIPQLGTIYSIQRGSDKDFGIILHEKPDWGLYAFEAPKGIFEVGEKVEFHYSQKNRAIDIKKILR